MNDRRHGAELRLDKWLWCARFFKSRAQATQAVVGGLVHLDARRVKPSRLIHVDDRLQITRGELLMEIIVTAIPVRRGPALEARSCYVETPASIAARERRARLRPGVPAPPPQRPDKHARRALRELRRG